MRGVIVLILMLFSLEAFADLQERIYFFTRQSELFHRICFNEQGEFMNVKFWDGISPKETAIDCHDQAIALNEEQDAIEAAIKEMGGEECDQEITSPELSSFLGSGTDVVSQAACPGMGSTPNCLKNISCNIVSSMLPMGSRLTQMVQKTSGLDLGCDGKDGGMNCGSAIGNSILDSLWDDVTGICWMVTFGHFCNGDSNTDPESITDTRAAAASVQDDGAMAQFRRDPLGFLKKMVEAIVDSIKNTVKTRYACNEWAGTPGLSACNSPIDELSWECQTCSQRMNVICGVSGYIGTQVISIFFTGGISGGAKALTEFLQHSSQAVKIAKLVSETKIAKVALQSARVGSRIGIWAGQKLGAVWAAIKGLDPVIKLRLLRDEFKKMGSAANQAAREIRLYASTQDAVAKFAREFNQLAQAAHMAGYLATSRVLGKTSLEVTEGWPRYVNVRQAQDLLMSYRAHYPADQAAKLEYRITKEIPPKVVIINGNSMPVGPTIRIDMPATVTKDSSPAVVTVIPTPGEAANRKVISSRERILSQRPVRSLTEVYEAFDGIRDPQLKNGFRAALNAMLDPEQVAPYVMKLQQDTFARMIASGDPSLVAKAGRGELDGPTMEAVLRARVESHGAKIVTIPHGAGELSTPDFQAKIGSGYLIDYAFSDVRHGSYGHLIQQDFTYDIIARESGKTHQEIIEFFGTPEGVKVWSKMYDATGKDPGPIQVERFRELYLKDIPLSYHPKINQSSLLFS